MATSSVRPDLTPIPKVYTGAAVSLCSVAVIALAKGAGIVLDPVLAGAIATVVYGAVAYLVPQKYQGHMAYFNRVAEILVAMHPGLSQPEVVKKLETPMAAARLIASTHAIADLKHERLSK